MPSNRLRTRPTTDRTAGTGVAEPATERAVDERRVDGAATMNRAWIAVGLLVAVVVASGIGAVVSTDLADVEAGAENDSTAGRDAGVERGSEADGDVSEFPEADGSEPFAFRIEGIENCGETCREVTATVENTRSESAEEVTVRTRIFAGENSTDEQIWENTETVGTLAAGETDSSTERVDLSLTEAYAIERSDGWITIETTVESAEETVTIRETRQVA